jgi:two-component system sensor histidine kinase MtrB
MTEAVLAEAPTARGEHGFRRLLHGPLAGWERLGLRGRVTSLFAFGALLLSILMGGLSYYATSHFLLSDQVNSAVKAARLAAATVETDLRQSNPPILQILGDVDATSGASSSVLFWNGSSNSSTFAVSSQDLPTGLVALVRSGTPATQNFMLNGRPQIAVGIPLVSVDAQYFVIFDVGNLDHTLHVLVLALVLGGLVTTVLGGAVGRLASGRTLRPSPAATSTLGSGPRPRIPT